MAAPAAPVVGVPAVAAAVLVPAWAVARRRWAVAVAVVVADQEEADLLVLGTHPMDEGDRPRGSTSQRVSWFSRRPVLLVP